MNCFFKLCFYLYFKFHLSFVQKYHPIEYNEYVQQRGNKRAKQIGFLPLSQEQFEFALAQLIVYAMLPLSFVAMDAFKNYTNSKWI